MQSLRAFLALARARRGPRYRAQLALEQLEEYSLPSASITGLIWNDLNGNGLRDAPELGLAAQVAYLDLNHNGQFDTTTVTRPAPSTSIGIAPGALGGFGGFMSSLQAEGLSGTLTNLAVNMDLANNGTKSVVVAVVSPTGLTVPNLPNLFTIRPGEHFVGTFDGNSTNSVATAPRPLPPGTYAPEQSFATPLSYINGTDPNGTWGLVFFGDTSKLDLKSWSLTFTTLEPNATTDASGAYSFQGLAPGSYDVRAALTGADTQTFPAGGAAQTVNAIDGRDATGINFGVKAAPDLTPLAFSVANPATSWGQNVTINYTISNQGYGAAGPFTADVRLSPDGRIGAAGLLLTSLTFAGLAPRSSISGSVTVKLPGAPPPGFGSAGNAYVGLVVDPDNAVAEKSETNNSDQGAGIDLARVDGTSGAAANVPIVQAGEIQQAPTLAVDPTNPLHMVAAYLDAPFSGAYTGLSVSQSTDGGVTWGARTPIALPAGFDESAAAPTVVFDAAGNIHISFMAVTYLGKQPKLPNPDSDERAFGFTANNGIFVVSSTDNGATWGAPQAVASNLYSGTNVPFETFPSMAADTSPKLADGVTPNPNFGNLYVSWSRFYPAGQFPGQPGSTAGSDVMVAVSRDGGQTWATQTQTDPDTHLTRSVILDPRFKDNGTGLPARGFVTFPTVTVGAGGDVFVSTYSGGDFTVYHSSNGGQTFTPPSYDSQTGLPFPTLNGIIVPSPTLPSTPGLAGMRTLPLRQIVADPTHAGRLYAVAVSAVTARVGPQAGQAIDPGDVLFASSDDFGQTWTSNFTILKQPPAVDRLTPAQIASYAPTLNDDNGGEPAGLAEDPATQVLAGQALPSLAVDGQGNVVVVWYDTRTGPLAPNNTGVVNALTVWGTVSTDGGRTFSPNFQISDTAFDPVNGRFVAGDGSLATYLGDQLGVVIANGTAYVAWTDSRDGRAFNDDGTQRLRQDIYLGKFAITPAPAAPTDRFAPNTTLNSATELGFVSAPLDLAKMVLTPGSADRWFHLEAGANGPLTVTATGGYPGDFKLEITDKSGKPVSFTLSDVTDASGAVVGKKAKLTASFGDEYFVHVSGTNDNELPFALDLVNLTADLGQQVQGDVDGTLNFGQDVYRLTAGVNGTLTIDLHGLPAQAFIVLTPNGFTALYDGTQTGRTHVTLPVTQGQTVLILVVDTDPLGSGEGPYNLTFTNTDQYSTAGSSTLFLPTNGDPASVAVSDFNGDGIKDILTTSTDRADVVNVFLGNGDGTFQAPRQFDVGPGLRGTLTADNRQPVITDVDSDGVPDVIVPNFRAADVSVLLGRGDGTFSPQERVDAVTSPDFTTTGDFNGDGKADLVVLQNFPQLGSVSQFSVLIGHGDGTFAPAVSYRTSFINGAGPVLTGDFTGDGKLDLIVFSKNTPLGELYRGNGDGTFTEMGTFRTPENTFSVQAVKLNADNILDLVFAGTNSGNVYTAIGNGDGTFQPAQKYTAMVAAPGDNVGVRSVALIDYDPVNSPLALPEPPFKTDPVTGAKTYTADYGNKALVLTAASRSGQGPAQVILIPELVDLKGKFAGFYTPVILADVKVAGNLATGDFDGDGKTDVAVADAGGVTVVYGISANSPSVPPNTTLATARQLATVTHYVTPALSIVKGHEDSYFKFTVPTESAAGSGAQVIDISAMFQYQTGPGLQMEILDAGGNVIATGPRARVVAAQGASLTVHVFGLTAGTIRGAGAYTLDIDVLPQVVSAQAQAFLPGGPATSIVLTLQGDRLDPKTAENPANYVVTWNSPTGPQVIPLAAVKQPVVYDPGANVNVSSGVTFPTAVRQTVTLVFSQPLPVGSYSIALSSNIQTAPFAAGETATLAGGFFFDGHPLVSEAGGAVRNGATFDAPGLVTTNDSPTSLGQFKAGTPFLTQLQNDLGALLDAQLRDLGDDPTITPAVMAQILSRVIPGLNPDGSDSLLILWLDPVSINLADSEGARTTYNEGSKSVAAGLANTFVEVGGNIELVVVAGARGTFTLNVGDVGDAARGGVALIDGGGTRTEALTDALRGGTDRFEFSFNSPAGAALTSAAGSGAASGAAAASDIGGAVAAAGRSSSADNGDSGNATTTAATTLLLLTTLTSPPDFGAAGSAGGALAGGGSSTGATAAAAPSSSTLYSGTGDGNSPEAQMSELSSSLAAMLTHWGGDKSGEAIRSALTRFAQLASLVQVKAGNVGSLPVAPAPRVKVGKVDVGGEHGPDVAVVVAKSHQEKAGNGMASEVAPADGAALVVAPLPVVTVVPTAPAIPGPEKVGVTDAEAVPGADVPDTRRVVGFGLAIGLASLGGIYLVEQSRPAPRRRAREPWEDELPRADQP